ncbi:MAG: hypothetical protein ABW098_14640 [Candidatus Thiodiazotropha sp.]
MSVQLPKHRLFTSTTLFTFLVVVFLSPYSITLASTIGTTDAVAKKTEPSGSESTEISAGHRVPADSLVSGKIGKNTLRVEIGTGVNLPNKEEFYGITAIGIQEVNNRPCRVQLFGGLLDHRFGPSDRKLGEAELARCGASVFLDYKAASFAERKNRYIRGIRACTETGTLTSKLIELKGLRIFPAEVKSTGEVVVRKQTDQFTRANCDNWHDKLTCGTSSILIGVIMHETDDQFVGIEPVCKSVKAMPEPPGFPFKDSVGH